MKRPWMPFYVADYLADTAHLRAAESGAYLHLIMHYWQHDGLPSDDRKLAAIARMTDAEWRRSRPTIVEFFGPNWRHKRIDKELAKAAAISCKRRASAMQRHCKTDAIAMQLDTHARATSQSQRKKEKEVPATNVAADVVGEDPRARLFRIGKTILVSFSVAEKRTGALIGHWLKQCDDPVGLLAAIEFARAQNVAEPIAYVSAVIKQGKSNGQGKQSLSELAFELATEVREREREAGIGRPDDPVGSD